MFVYFPPYFLLSSVSLFDFSRTVEAKFELASESPGGPVELPKAGPPSSIFLNPVRGAGWELCLSNASVGHAYAAGPGL